MIEPVTDIRYLERHEIDNDKWDQCIIHAPNGLIYAQTFYLDAMAGNWSAIVEGDYQHVMPLTWNKKFGFNYLYQPYFVKVLGVFGKSSTRFEISTFLNAIPGKFRYWDLDLNENNFVSCENEKFRLDLYTRTNYLLPLIDDYEQIRHQYKRLANRMKKRAVDNALQIVRDADPATIIDLYRRDYSNKQRSVPDIVYKKLKKCTDFAHRNKKAATYLAKSILGETLAYYIVLQDNKFIYSLIGGSTKEGKKLGAFYLLTDAIILDHAGTGKIFRFEGSDIPGISFFDALFGPEKITYQHIVMNNLPFPLKLFK